MSFGKRFLNNPLFSAFLKLRVFSQVMVFVSFILILFLLNSFLDIMGLYSAGQDIKSLLPVIIRTAVIALLIGIFIPYLLNKAIKSSVQKPMDSVKIISEALSAGDLSKNVEASGCREIVDLCTDINKAIGGLRKFIANITDQSDILYTASEDLMSNSKASSEASGQVAVAMQDLAKGATEQAERLSEAVEDIGNLSSLVRKVTDETEEIAAASEILVNSASAGQQISNEIDSQMNQLYTSTKGIEAAISELGKSSEEVGKMNEAIKEIAGQTKLLALNASIEAARAGEHGKGFAVVATETGKLAQRSMQTAALIKDLLDQINIRNTHVTEVLQSSIKQVEAGKEMTENSHARFEEIFHSLDKNIKQIAEVVKYTREMSESNNNVSDRVSSIASFSEEITASTEEVLAIANEQGKSAQQFMQLAGNLMESANVLKKSINVHLNFTYFGTDKRDKVTKQAIEAYRKQHSNINMNANYIASMGNMYGIVTPQFDEGTAPDILQIERLKLVELGTRDDCLIDLFKEDVINLKNFDRNALSTCVVKNKLVGIPAGLNIYTCFTNVEFMKKHGIPLDLIWDWDNLMKIGAEISRKNPDDILLYIVSRQAAYFAKMYIRQKTGEEFIKDDYTMGFDKHVVVEAFNTYLKLIDCGAAVIKDGCTRATELKKDPEFVRLSTSNGKTRTTYFHSGKVGMYFCGSSEYLTLDKTPFAVDVMNPPVIEGAKVSGLMINPSVAYAVNKKCENAREAMKFINWMVGNPEAIDILRDIRGYPASIPAKKLLEEKGVINPEVGKAIDIGLKNGACVENSLSSSTKLVDLLVSAIEGVGNHEMTPEEAADKFIGDTQQWLISIQETKKKKFRLWPF